MVTEFSSVNVRILAPFVIIATHLTIKNAVNLLLPGGLGYRMRGLFGTGWTFSRIMDVSKESLLRVSLYQAKFPYFAL
jgi:hypothetical protein